MLTLFSNPQQGWTTPATPQFIKNTAHNNHRLGRTTQSYKSHQKQRYRTKRLNVHINPTQSMLPMVRHLPIRPTGIYGKWRITPTHLINLDERYLTFLPHKKRQSSTRRIFAVGQQLNDTPSFSIQNYQKLLTAIIYNPFFDKPYHLNRFIATFRLT